MACKACVYISNVSVAAAKVRPVGKEASAKRGNTYKRRPRSRITIEKAASRFTWRRLAAASPMPSRKSRLAKYIAAEMRIYAKCACLSWPKEICASAHTHVMSVGRSRNLSLSGRYRISPIFWEALLQFAFARESAKREAWRREVRIMRARVRARLASCMRERII